MANFPDLTSEGVERISSTALENAHQITTSQSILFGFDGRNTDTVNEAFIWVFDTASGVTGNFPVLAIEVGKAGTGGAGNFSYQAPLYGIKFKNGIYIVGSSGDVGAFAALASNKLFFHVQYASEDGVTNPS